MLVGFSWGRTLWTGFAETGCTFASRLSKYSTFRCSCGVGRLFCLMPYYLKSPGRNWRLDAPRMSQILCIICNIEIGKRASVRISFLHPGLFDHESVVWIALWRNRSHTLLSAHDALVTPFRIKFSCECLPAFEHELVVSASPDPLRDIVEGYFTGFGAFAISGFCALGGEACA